MKPDPTTYSKQRPKCGQISDKEHEMKLRAIGSVVFLMLLSTVASAQSDKNGATSQEPKASQPGQGPFTNFNKFAYARIKTILLASAEKMPDENYNFKPTDAVRSYGQIVGHLADAQYNFCSIALGEKSPGLKIEETKKTKTELVAALKDSVTYCDKAYDTMTDAAGAQMMQLVGTEMSIIRPLNVNNMHDMEHYGNLVTYMRLKNIVPPTSEQAPAAQPKKQN